MNTQALTLFLTKAPYKFLKSLKRSLEKQNEILNPWNASNAPFYQQKVIRVLWKHKVISSPFSNTLNIFEMQKSYTQATSCSSRGSLLIIFIFLLITIYFAQSAWSKNKYAFQHHLIRSIVGKGKDSKAMQISPKFQLLLDWKRWTFDFQQIDND